MRSKTLFALLCAGCALATVLSSAQDQPSEHEQHHPKADSSQQDSATPASAPNSGMMDEKCAMMQKDMDKMHAEMRASQARLDALIKEMNTTTGAQKVDALAAAVNQMAQESAKMQRMHEEMMTKMMQHVSEHMMQGMASPPKSEMMMCPMMKGDKDSAGGASHGKDSEAPTPKPPADGSSEDHSAHHPPAL